MSADILFVKNMVCLRCILAVEDVLRDLVIPFKVVSVGEIQLLEKMLQEKTDLLCISLARIGLELIDNRTAVTIEKIKQLIIKKARIELDEKDTKIKLSVYLSRNLHHEYTYLSSLFSLVEGRTIKNYFIEHRIEKVKELLGYKEMTLSEISFVMEYSSVAHLSNQFKKITGFTPSRYKQGSTLLRKPLDFI